MPAPNERLRVGKSWRRTLVEHTPDDHKGRLVGVVDTPELADEIAQAVNLLRDLDADQRELRHENH